MANNCVESNANPGTHWCEGCGDDGSYWFNYVGTAAEAQADCDGAQFETGGGNGQYPGIAPLDKKRGQGHITSQGTTSRRPARKRNFNNGNGSCY